jgi:nucleotide-binding universal stress UspA family protein
MSYAALITQVQADAEAAPRLACALDLAKRYGAMAIGVGAETIPPVAVDSGFYSAQADFVVAMRNSIEARLEVARENFCSGARREGVEATWCSGLQLPAPAVAAASRAADIIVAGGAPRHNNDRCREAEAAELAIISGRPVLVAPSHGRPLEAKHVVLAWKETREARRALSDAMPLFERAEAVAVVQVCGRDESGDAKGCVEDVAAMLRRRKINAEGRIVTREHADSQQILREASAFGADLIVMGAYGHTRLGEWVFGGFTRDLLSQDDVYLLLSH